MLSNFQFSMKKEQFLFWRNAPHAWLLSVLIFLVMASIVFMLVARHWGHSWVYLWDVQASSQIQNSPLISFEKGILPFQMQVPVYFLQYEYIAQDLHIPLWASKAWVIGIFLGFSVLISAVTSFKRLYFLLSTTLAILFLVSLRMDLIGIWGLYSKWLFSGLAIFLYVGLAYYFHTFGKNIGFGKKILANLLISCIFLTLIFTKSEQQIPSAYLAGYGMIFPFLLTLTTIFLVATEIPFTFASFTSTLGNKQRLEFKSFHIVMLFYIGNLVLLYLKNTKMLVLDIFYIDDLYLLAASLILGIWGTRYNPLFQSVVTSSVRTWVYATMALIAALTIAYLHAVANEAAIAALEDFVVYAHLGFGAVIWIYTTFNFKNATPPDSNNTSFVAEFYGNQEQKSIPFYIARGLGFLVMGIFIFKENSFPIKQSFAAYYNGLGDVYLLHYNEFNHRIADAYYSEALTNDEINHRLWFSRAALTAQKPQARPEEIAERINQLQKATLRDAIPQDYALIAQEFAKSGQDLLANLEFREGFEHFPKSPQLANNISLIYARNKVLDSALYYFKTYEKYASNESEKDINFLALLLQKPFIPRDSVERFLKKGGDAAYEANRLAILHLYNKPVQEEFKLDFARKSQEDTSALDIIQASYLHNFLLTSQKQDTLALHITKKLASTQANASFLEFLKLAQQSFWFKNKDQQSAIENSRFLAYLSPKRYLMPFGQHLLLLNQPEQAAMQFAGLANTPSYYSTLDVFYHLGATLAEKGSLSESEKLWQRVAQDSSNAQRSRYAQKMIRIIQADSQKWETYDDTTRFGLIYYHKNLPKEVKNKISLSIQNPDLKVKAFAHLIHLYLDENQTEQADSLFQKLDKNLVVTLSAQTELNAAYLKLCYQKQDWQSLQKVVANIPLSFAQEYLRTFYQALLAEDNRQKEALFRKALQGNPFDLSLYSAVIRFYNEQKKDKETAYNWAVQAIRFQENDARAWKIYIQQCLEANYLDFAEQGLLKLQELAPEDYRRFQTIYEKQKALSN